MRNPCQEIKKHLKRAKTAIIATHIDPDGDAVGSMLALGMILERLKISVTLYEADPIPKIYNFLPDVSKITRTVPPGQYFDLAFVIDSSDLSRIGDKIDLLSQASFLVNVDHHPDNAMFGQLNCVSKSSSVAEHIYDLAKFLKIKIDKKMADCLYTSIITDTGNFRYDNTTEKTLRIAAELINCGVNTHELTTQIYDTRSLPAVKISAAALSNIRFSTDHKIGWTIVTEAMMSEAGAKGEDLNGIVDQIRSIEGIEVAILFREEKDKVKVNFRSKENVNVSHLAKQFGGGGHIKAAGAVIESSINRAETDVIATVMKYFEARKYLV